jgi:hypothetical protein
VLLHFVASNLGYNEIHFLNSLVNNMGKHGITNEQDFCIFNTWSMALYFLVARVGTSFYLLYFISSD